MAKSSLCHLFCLRGSQLERCRSAGNPNDVALKSIQSLPTGFQPITKPKRFFDHDFDFRITGGMQLRPVNHFGISVEVLIGDCVVPTVGVGFNRLQGLIKVNTPDELPGVFSVNVRPVPCAERPKARLKCAGKIRRRFHCTLEGPSRSHEFATARATAKVARPLNSESPPQPDFPSPSASGSNLETSLAIPLSRSK